MMRNVFFFLLLCLFFIACQEENAGLQYPKGEVPAETLVFSCGVDTVLVAENGIKLDIRKETFDCGEKKVVELKLRAVLSKADMFRYRMATTSSDGRILESGGMFQVEVTSVHTINPDAPLKLNIPAKKGLKGDMQLFKLVPGDAGLWNPVENKISFEGMETIEIGEKLFKTHCAQCHNKNLRNALTGPPLGNIHLYRDRDWLIDFTKNSQQMIASGDSLSVCVWSAWRPTVMTSFEFLSDEKISSIYDYIANQSLIVGLAPNREDFIYDCSNLIRVNRNGVGDSDRTATFAINDTMLNLTSIDTSYFLNNYVVEILGDNWYNVDRYWDAFDTIDRPVLSTQKMPLRDHMITLISKYDNVQIPFIRSDEGTYLLQNSEGKPTLNFPTDEAFYIVGYYWGEEGIQSAFMEYTFSKTGNEIQLEFSPTTDEAFFTFLENLK